MSEIAALDRPTFVERLGFLFEGSPWIVAEAWDSRPWRTREALHAALLEVVARASQERQLALIRAHPDLVGRAALTGTLTRESTDEQRTAGLDPNVLSEEEIAWFQDSNAKYQAKFGFPFVICTRDNQKDDHRGRARRAAEQRPPHGDRDRAARDRADRLASPRRCRAG